MTAWKLASGLLAVLLCATALTGCTRSDPVMVALLLPNANADRWERIDDPAFRTRVARTCRGCELQVHLADGDAARQAGQFRDAVRAGADVVVLAAVEPRAAEELVAEATVPVIAYDRFIAGADHYVSHDNERIGALQAEGLLEALDGRGRILMIHGGQADPNAAEIKLAAKDVLDGTDVEVVDEIDPSDWSAEQAQQWVSTTLDREGARSIDAIYAANDTQAGGVVEAVREAGLAVRSFPVITGQDAELDAVRRLVLGEQTTTVMKQIREQAEQAADISVAILTDTEIEGGEPHEGVRSWILAPEPVTLATIADTVVRRGQLTLADICEGETADRCAELGLR